MTSFTGDDDTGYAKTWLTTDALTDHYHCTEEEARRGLLDHEYAIRSRLVQVRADYLTGHVPFEERDEPLLYGEPFKFG